MRNMSYSLTTRQYEDRSKTVTRRLGWNDLKAGEEFMGVEKGMGLKKGEKVRKLHASRCVMNTPEPLWHIVNQPADCAKEGFPDMTPEQFIEMFCKHNACTRHTIINRIEFIHL